MAIGRAAVAGGVLAGALLVQGLAAAPAALAWTGDETGIGWQYSEEGGGYYRPPQGSEGSPGEGGVPTSMVIVGERGEWLDCEDADDPEARNCDPDEGGSISRLCGETDLETGRPQYPSYTYSREIGEDDEPEPWVVDEPPDHEWCLVPEDDDWVPIEEITEDVEFEVFQPLGDPEIKINPGDEAIVNLPTVVSTDYPGDFPGPGQIVSMEPLVVRIPIDIEKPGENLTGEILAEGEFTWTFEQGGTVTGRGKPYEPAIDPRDDGGYYVSNVFHEPGDMTIDLDVLFTGEVTVEGLEPEPIDPVDDINATTEIPVTELNNVLN